MRSNGTFNRKVLKTFWTVRLIDCIVLYLDSPWQQKNQTIRCPKWNENENELTKNYFVKFWRIGCVLCNSYIDGKGREIWHYILFLQTYEIATTKIHFCWLIELIQHDHLQKLFLKIRFSQITLTVQSYLIYISKDSEQNVLKLRKSADNCTNRSRHSAEKVDQ